jgi:beta-alanine degradation protein BauB
VSLSPDELERASANRKVGSRLLFENDAVRIWDITLGPGERLPFHLHATSYFYRCTSAGRVRVHTPDGGSDEYEAPLDEVAFHEIGPDDLFVHDLENVGDTVVAYTTVELLR